MPTTQPAYKKDDNLANLVHELVRQIPKGRVTSYGAIAKSLGIPNPRMVGWAMHTTENIKKNVPAQRVVNSTGHITGGHPEFRRDLLIKDGVKVINNRVADFKRLFWDPALEL
ncbi:MAG: MGMT family protein [Puia sp.]|nr:MGMT family protein [Puia sp.]